MTTPTVVRMQFQDEVVRPKKRIDRRLMELPEGELEIGQLDRTKYVYFANAKTFEQFTKMAKVQPNRRNLQIMKEEAEEEWSRYLDSYYLNIRKVKPLLKKDFELDEVALQKKLCSDEPKGKSLGKNSESSEMMKMKANIHIRTHSKR